MERLETPQQPAERQVSSLMQVVAGELSTLHGAMERLQNTLAGLVPQLPGHENRWSELQEIDRITQTLGELSTFLAAMGGSLSPALVIDVSYAMSRVRLSGLQHSLSGNRSGEEVSVPGHVEFF